MHLKSIGLIAVAALLAAACGTLAFPGFNTITSRYSDPTGDILTPPPSGGTLYDVTQVVTNRIDNPPGGAYDTLQVVITFNQAVVLPPPGSMPDTAGTQLGNLIHMDTDRNPATGFSNSPCGLNGLEFLVDGSGTRLTNGNYPVFTGFLFSSLSGEATPSVAGNILTVNIPLSALGGDDGETNLVEVASQRFGGGINFTDCAPNMGGAVVTRHPDGSKGVTNR